MARTALASNVAVLASLEGLISEQVGLKLGALASTVPADQAIVEVGSYKGKSTAYLASGAIVGLGAHVYAVDAWDSLGNAGGRFGFNRAETYASFLHQLKRAGVREQVTPLRGFSADIARHWHGRRIGLLYIDGSHIETDVRTDWLVWRKHLAPNAIVAFDDYDTERNPGVKKVVDSIREVTVWDTSVPPLAFGVVR
jgi:hypothetical protein